MVGPFYAGLGWLFLAGALCLFLAYWLKRAALQLLARAFGVSGFTLALYAMLTLPGVILHEGAHALSALLLRVPVRGAALIPRRSPDDLSLEAFVQVSPRDPLRMALVALAPLLAGTVVLGLLTRTLGVAGQEVRPWARLAEWATSIDWHRAVLWATIYLIWTISSHMAPSRVDLCYVQNGAVVLLAILLALGLLLTRFGASAVERVGGALGRLGDGLAVGAILNGIILLPLALLVRLVGRKK